MSESEVLTSQNFERINFFVWLAEIDGGFYHGGTSVIVNLQNSNKLFIKGPGDTKKEWPIKSFDEGLRLANKYFSGDGLMTFAEKLDRLDGIFAWDHGCGSSGIEDDVFKHEIKSDLELKNLLLQLSRQYLNDDDCSFEDLVELVRWAETELGFNS